MLKNVLLRKMIKSRIEHTPIKNALVIVKKFRCQHEEKPYFL